MNTQTSFVANKQQMHTILLTTSFAAPFFATVNAFLAIADTMQPEERKSHNLIKTK